MLMPYLHFNGNCEEAMNFYAAVFGRTGVHIARMNNDPANPVMHASVQLTESGGVSGADFEDAVPVSGMEILVILPTREEIEEIFPKLAAGGTILSGFQPHPPPDDASGAATVLDKYGYTWFLST